MSDLLVALGLVLVIEGVLYAAFPETMKRAVQVVLDAPQAQLRAAALGAAALGVAIVWLARG